MMLDKNSPLYRDMEDIIDREAKGQLKLYTHDEVWKEGDSLMLEGRLDTIGFSEVIDDLCRKDLDGTFLIPHLPDKADVEKVLSDEATVSYYIYTKEKIYHVWIFSNGNVDMIDGKMTAWDEEDWDCVVLDR